MRPRGSQAVPAALLACLLALAPTGIGAEEPPRPAASASGVLLAVKKDARPGIPLTLNLADPSHRGFLASQLRQAGVLADRGYGAELHRSLETLAERDRQRPPSQELTFLQRERIDGRWLPGGLITHLGPTSNKEEYVATASLAVRGNVHGILLLQLYDSRQWRPIGKLAVVDEWLDSHLVVSATGKSDRGDVAAVFTHLYLDEQGMPVAQVIFQSIGKFVDPQFSQLAPCLSTDSSCINGSVPSGSNQYTKICMNGRTGSDCAQTLPGGGPTTPQLNMNGLVSGLSDDLASGNSWKPTDTATVLSSSSGNCNASSSGIAFNFVNTTSFSWTGTPVSYSGTCLGTSPPSGNVNFSLTFSITTTGAPVSFSILGNSTCVPVPASSTACIRPLTMVYGCLPAGTPVRMADGSLRKIEDVDVQQQVRSGTGQALTVVDTLRGSEADPLVAIADDRGNRLTLTKTHPVITGRGLVQADQLKLGDELRTEAGPAKIVQIERPAAAGPVQVYNLNLGAPGERFDPDDTTLFAGGILVGDNQMQNRLEEASRIARPEDVPPHFRADYAEWVKARLAQRARP